MLPVLAINWILRTDTQVGERKEWLGKIEKNECLQSLEAIAHPRSEM